MQKRRDKYGFNNKKKWLGTGNIGATPEQDFQKEQKIIQKELQRCGLVSSNA